MPKEFLEKLGCPLSEYLFKLEYELILEDEEYKSICSREEEILDEYPILREIWDERTVKEDLPIKEIKALTELLNITNRRITKVMEYMFIKGYEIALKESSKK